MFLGWTAADERRRRWAMKWNKTYKNEEEEEEEKEAKTSSGAG